MSKKIFYQEYLSNGKRLKRLIKYSLVDKEYFKSDDFLFFFF